MCRAENMTAIEDSTFLKIKLSIKCVELNVLLIALNPSVVCPQSNALNCEYEGK